MLSVGGRRRAFGPVRGCETFVIGVKHCQSQTSHRLYHLLGSSPRVASYGGLPSPQMVSHFSQT